MVKNLKGESKNQEALIKSAMEHVRELYSESVDQFNFEQQLNRLNRDQLAIIVSKIEKGFDPEVIKER